jgi:Raf kinase inhibitor-like YbhB/YbcL family protein
MRTRHAARAAANALALSTALALGLVACSHDGRTLRPAGPDQTLSIITTTTETATTQGEAVNAGTGGGGDDEAAPGMSLTAPWLDSSDIPAKYTCKGANVAPGLSWANVPTNAAELAVTITDSDANDYVQWAIAGIDPASTGIAEGRVPNGAVQADNSGGTEGYTGPCPPSGTHHYLVTLYALSQPSGLTAGSDPADALASLQQLAISSVAVSGTFAGS